MKHLKPFFLFLTLLFLLNLVSCSNKPSRKYNIVLIVIDTLRADHLSFYGYKKNTAPFLSKIAKDAIVFKHTFSPSSWTAPATASIFTSLYPFQHGVLMCLLAIKRAKRLNPNITINKIPQEITTLPEVLKKNGYKTFGISDNLNIGELEGFTQGFDKFKTYGYKKAPFITKKILEWKKELLSSKKYFLFIQFMDPHAPYHKRYPWYKPQKNLKKEMISRYDSEINFVDSFIRKLYLELGWDKNTLLIITSDHGEGLWDHGHMDHGQSLFLEEINVPLIIKLPEIKKGKKIYTPVSTIDIFPTIVRLFDFKIRTKLEGVNLIPLINDKKYEKNRYIFSYLWKKIDKVKEFKAVIFHKYHYIENNKGDKFLFDMSNDKKEKFNIYSLHPETALLLRKKFYHFFRNSRKYQSKKTSVTLDKEKLKILKSLGYVN